MTTANAARSGAAASADGAPDASASAPGPAAATVAPGASVPKSVFDGIKRPEPEALPNRPSKRLKQSLAHASKDECEVYYENGLRKTKPYTFDYRSNVKARWIGRTLMDVFSKEFLDLTPEYVVRSSRPESLASPALTVCLSSPVFLLLVFSLTCPGQRH
ncbi:hypothetical protein H696_05487 [Fonticula alba]|uniref:Uncharacterized protein n=1 Tax=Fonticula alba TaxID=691883 RepID=A0A058Z185_FONAL|nr:hypothetical protein H696_05487 [Fonticula alba]KCV68019.1 hypothetical protein H696_05487 [Fonticula alba]|eukprot:XP_009497586.1 hypothetical protein H696_05487 [Fonticula alba]